MLIGGLWGLATLEQFFLNVWLNFEPGWLIKAITLPGYLADKIPYYKLQHNIFAGETLAGVFSILVPIVIGGFIGVLIHKMNKEGVK